MWQRNAYCDAEQSSAAKFWKIYDLILGQLLAKREVFCLGLCEFASAVTSSMRRI
jgi:hypothetical protein